MSATGEHVLPPGHSTVYHAKVTPLIDYLPFKDGDFPWLIVFTKGHLLIYPMSTMSYHVLGAKCPTSAWQVAT